MSRGAAHRSGAVTAWTPKTSSEKPFSFWDLLQEELRPYPGRVSIVIRMVLAATISILCIMAGHLPEGALGVYFALVIEREDLRASFENAVLRILIFGMATLYVLVGAALFVASPFTHFLWVIGSLFLLFFILRAGISYSLSGAFALMVTAALPTWDRPYNVNTKVSLTLYLFFTIAIGSLSGLLVEAVYRSFYTTDPILSGLSDRRQVSAAMLTAAANGCEPGKDHEAKLRQYAMTGPRAAPASNTLGTEHECARSRLCSHRTERPPHRAMRGAVGRREAPASAGYGAGAPVERRCRRNAGKGSRAANPSWHRSQRHQYSAAMDAE